ncbi:MAG: hypothetical protein OYG32_09955 [Rhodospirillaceae bacterium]|nr:hypothetical protein [Rhodospirillaceae bacterium]MDE0255108.1 hypothetical protein [Rhodospirillaceae bacterium]MDE0619119.1 hypothetical protein [Rhodospirillaceae bacterium]
MLDGQIVDVLAADHPQSVRHVFYRMTDPRLAAPVEKTENGYQRVQRRCLALRRSGSIPYGWIADATRRGFHVSTFNGQADFIRRMQGLYRQNLWTDDLPRVEVWCESRSIAGVLQDDCQALAVSLFPSGGFASATLCYEAAEDINWRRPPRAVVIYVGDYDPAGVLIDRSIEMELRQHLEVELDFRRVAINEGQIAEYDLPTKPRKGTERRRLDIAATVEAEAMPANVLRGIVRDAVEGYLPAGALDVAREAEESEREGLQFLADAIEQAEEEGIL